MAEHAVATQAAPADPTARVESIDVVRGFALLGILAMNVAVFAMPFAAYQNPTIVFPYEGLNRVTYWVVHVLFELKMMSIFSMLFGAGVVMWDDKVRRRWQPELTGGTPANVPPLTVGTGLWMRRMGWLLLFGLLHAYLVWEGDILVYYALTGMILIWWLRRLQPWLMVMIAALMLIPPSLLISATGFWAMVNEHPIVALGVGVPQDAIAGMSQGYNEFRVNIEPTPEEIQDLVTTMQGGWLTVAKERAVATFFIQVFAFPTSIFWRAGSMMLLGAALYKSGFLTGRLSNRTYALSALAGYTLGLPLVITGIIFNEQTRFDPGMFLLAGAQYNTFGSVAMALGHVALLIWLLRLGVLGVIGRSLAAVGRMALSNYLAHSLICSFVFYGFGLGRYGTLDRFEQQLVVVGIWAAQLIWSPIWLSMFRFGPAEWVWRSLTYWKLQPMRRA